MIAKALLVLACVLLAVPALFVGAKGLAAIRRRTAVVQGRTITGARAVGAGLVLVGWAAGMVAFALLVLASMAGR